MHSKSNNCKLLYINFLERYLSEHNITPKELSYLCKKNQVFENIEIQYDYLQEVSEEEIYSYIKSILNNHSKPMIVFHGSSFDFCKINLKKSKDKRDFGKGFYTTLLENQALLWAKRQAMRKNSNNYFVYKYMFFPDKSLSIKHFAKVDEEWLHFIKLNRLKGGISHNFDIVIGPVADDNVLSTLNGYLSNIYTTKETLARLQYTKLNNQVSFHTEKAIKFLELIECDKLERGDF